jgi:hypothetical protein
VGWHKLLPSHRPYDDETGRQANPPKTAIKKFEARQRRCPFTTPPKPHALNIRDNGADLSKSVHRQLGAAIAMQISGTSIPIAAAKHQPARLQAVMHCVENKACERDSSVWICDRCSSGALLQHVSLRRTPHIANASGPRVTAPGRLDQQRVTSRGPT